MRVHYVFASRFRVTIAACVGFGRAARHTSPTCQAGLVCLTRKRPDAPKCRPVVDVCVMCARQDEGEEGEEEEEEETEEEEEGEEEEGEEEEEEEEEG